MQRDANDVLAMRSDDGRVALIDIGWRTRWDAPGFDPAIASQMSRPVAIRLGMRRSAKSATDLVTALVTGHTTLVAGAGFEPATCGL
jgi:hypothetical protein